MPDKPQMFVVVGKQKTGRLLTDTLDGDVGAIEDDDLGHERPNDQRVPRAFEAPRNDGNETSRVMGVSLCVAR